jgi:antitoxin (DNA-binding transcriptional repressor) of toxin-antitoxin stability system
MKFITVRQLRNKSAEVWKTLSKEKDVVLTGNGKPIALLTKINEDTLESTLTAMRRQRALEALDRAQAKSLRLGNNPMSLKKINAEIKAARKLRKK